MAESPPEIVVMDVGHGNSALIIEPDWAVLIDARRGGVVDDTLRRFGVTMLDDVVISHADLDHSDGLTTLLLGDPCGVKRVHLKADPFKDKPTWRELIVALEEPEARGVQINTGLCAGHSVVSPSGRTKIEVLAPSGTSILRAPHPQLNAGLTTNGMSTVLRVLVDDEPTLLLPGDVDFAGFRRLIGSGADISASTLVFPHHGGTPGNTRTEEFAREVMAAVAPNHVIFSAHRNAGTFPRPEIVREVATRAARVSCTQLSKLCQPQDDLVINEGHLSPLPAMGKRGRCCAGSIHLTFDPQTTIPLVSAHESFKDDHAPGAMCRP